MGSSKAAAAASMKVHQIARGLWAAASPDHEPSGLSLAAAASCKRLRPLAPKLSAPESPAPTAFDLKSFIRPESGPRKLGCSSPDSHVQGDSPPVETHHQGGTRWNPTQEQIGILEMLYRSGMRTPNAQQIEHITAQLRKYGKIEGKNVFYWFQNHKARERQKQKRINLGLGHCPRTPTSPTTVITTITLSSTTTSREESEVIRDDDSPFKRNCRSWAFEFLEEDHSKVSCRDHQAAGREDRTLELFPLHPEGIRLLL